MCLDNKLSRRTIHAHDQICAMRRPAEAHMALFGMVWLLRVRSEMKRCAKCRRQQQEMINVEDRASVSTFFTIDAPSVAPTGSSPVGPTTFCEVHGYNLPKEGTYKTVTCFLYLYVLQTTKIESKD